MAQFLDVITDVPPPVTSSTITNISSASNTLSTVIATGNVILSIGKLLAGKTPVSSVELKSSAERERRNRELASLVVYPVSKHISE